MLELGKLKSKFSVAKGDSRGSIEVYEEGIALHLGKSKSIRFNYVDSLSKNADLALNKVSATINYFDMFCNRESETFSMQEHDFRALKKILGK
jgi:hypothetical protein